MNVLLQVTSILLLSLSAHAEDLYDPMTSNVGILTPSNWKSQVDNSRQKGGIYIVHFYNERDGQSYDFSLDFVKKSLDLKGIFSLAQVNCTSYADLCKKQVTGELPSLMVYPPFPVPPKNFKLSEVNRSIGYAVRHLSHSVVEINDESYIGFLQSEKAMPKILLFTNKPKGIPLLAKGISNAFAGKMKFGLIRAESTEVVEHFGVSDFPMVLLHKQGQKKPLKYTGEIKFQALFDFLNIHSEQFVPKSSSNDNEEEKTWIYEILPELHAKSSDDICVGTTKTLCVILFAAEKPDKTFISSIKSLKNRYEVGRDDAIKFKFMWLDRNLHKDWSEKFGVDESLSIQAAVLNPGRRKRFVRIDGEFSEESVSKMLEKILGGDARFTRLRDVPEFTEDL
jgi:hypothetical protein